jgi:hypothetical protein
MFYEHKLCFYEHKTYAAAKTTRKESMVDFFKIYKPSEMQRAKQAGYKEKEASLNEDNTKFVVYFVFIIHFVNPKKLYFQYF